MDAEVVARMLPGSQMSGSRAHCSSVGQKRLWAKNVVNGGGNCLDHGRVRHCHTAEKKREDEEGMEKGMKGLFCDLSCPLNFRLLSLSFLPGNYLKNQKLVAVGG